MKHRLPLMWLALYRRRRLLISLAVGLALFETLIVVVALAVPTEELLATKPSSKSLETFSGSSGSVQLASLPGLLGAGLLHPFWIALQLSAVASLGAALVASDVEEGTIELVAVRPLSRARILLERTCAMMGASAVLAFVALLPIFVGGFLVDRLDEATSMLGLFLGALSGFALMLCFAGIAIAVSCSVSRRSTVLAAVGGVAAVAYATMFISAAWSSANWARYVSPFNYYKPADVIVSGTLNLSDIAVLVCVFVIGAAIGSWSLARRDLSS